MRSTLSPAFTSSKIRAMLGLMSECAEEYANYLTRMIDTNQPMWLEMKDTYVRFSNDVIASAAFGMKYNSLENKQNKFFVLGNNAITFTGMQAMKFFVHSISSNLGKLFKISLFNNEFRNFFRGIITSNIKIREKNEIIRPDMINLLMEARKGKLQHENINKQDEDTGFATVEESHIGKEKNQTGFGKLIIKINNIISYALTSVFQN